MVGNRRWLVIWEQLNHLNLLNDINSILRPREKSCVVCSGQTAPMTMEDSLCSVRSDSIRKLTRKVLTDVHDENHLTVC